MKNKIFCIGLGRTGTTTLSACLSELGYKHFGWTAKNHKLRSDLGLLSFLDTTAFINSIKDFDSVDDYPIPLIFEEIYAVYPEAKFIFTVRESAHQWATSIINEFNRKKINHGEHLWCGGLLISDDRYVKLIHFYNQHYDRVKNFFRDKNNFLELCWERGDSWSELCIFLNKEIPSKSLPHLNKSYLKNTELSLVENIFESGDYRKLCLYLKDQGNPKLVQYAKKLNINKIRASLKVAGVPQYQYNLAVCSIFKDEASYLNEWLKFHHKIGVEHFFLYNDASGDNYLEVLKPWLEANIVTLVDWPLLSQLKAYNHCLQNNKKNVKWLAFIDIDEFLFSPTKKPLTEILEKYSKYPAIFVYWALYGSSGHIEKPMGGVIDSFTYHQSLQSAIQDEFDHGDSDSADYVTAWSRDGKSIVQTSAVKVMGVHQPSQLYWGHVIDEGFHKMPESPLERRTEKKKISYSILRINHYWSKSLSELKRRSERGDVHNRKRPKKNISRLLEREVDLNEVRDVTILEIFNNENQ
jgi:hypothetical protein